MKGREGWLECGGEGVEEGGERDEGWREERVGEAARREAGRDEGTQRGTQEGPEARRKQ